MAGSVQDVKTIIARSPWAMVTVDKFTVGLVITILVLKDAIISNES